VEDGRCPDNSHLGVLVEPAECHRATVETAF
jgi:hypothetical protein